MDADRALDISQMKALSDETRLKIVEMLSCGELCACDLLESFDITQPTLSYHMKILTESGLVNADRHGTWIHYSLDIESFDRLSTFVKDLSVERADCACRSKRSNRGCCEGDSE